jgi:hypothetical protein
VAKALAGRVSDTRSPITALLIENRLRARRAQADVLAPPCAGLALPLGHSVR